MLSWTRVIPGPGTEDVNLLVKKTHTQPKVMWALQAVFIASSKIYRVGIFWGRFPLFNCIFSFCFILMFWLYNVYFTKSLATKCRGKDGKAWHLVGIDRFFLTILCFFFHHKNQVGEVTYIHKFKRHRNLNWENYLGVLKIRKTWLFCYGQFKRWVLV
jgi:hypothetical protein